MTKKKISGKDILLAPAKNSDGYNELLHRDILNLSKRYDLTLEELIKVHEELIILKDKKRRISNEIKTS